MFKHGKEHKSTYMDALCEQNRIDNKKSIPRHAIVKLQNVRENEMLVRKKVEENFCLTTKE